MLLCYLIGNLLTFLFNMSEEKLKLNGCYKMWLAIQVTKMECPWSVLSISLQASSVPTYPSLISVSQFLLSVNGKRNPIEIIFSQKPPLLTLTHLPWMLQIFIPPICCFPVTIIYLPIKWYNFCVCMPMCMSVWGWRMMSGVFWDSPLPQLLTQGL